MPVDIEEYSSFIKSVQIVNVYSGKLYAESFMELDKFFSATQRDYNVGSSFSVRLVDTAEGPSGRSNMVGEGSYTVEIHAGDSEKLQLFGLVTVKLVALYSTDQRGAPSAILDQFAQMNLPLNLWPYAREIINSQTMRMGISPITLGVYHYVPTH